MKYKLIGESLSTETTKLDLLEKLKKSGIDIAWGEHTDFNNVWCAEICETLYTLSLRDDILIFEKWKATGRCKSFCQMNINEYGSYLSKDDFGMMLVYIDRNSKEYKELLNIKQKDNYDHINDLPNSLKIDNYENISAALATEKISMYRGIRQFNFLYSLKGILFEKFKNNKKSEYEIICEILRKTSTFIRDDEE